MAVRLHADEIPLCLQIGHQRPPRGVALHPLVFAAPVIDGGVVVHHLDHRQIVPLADQEVVGVMRRRNLDAAGPEADFHILVPDDRNLPVHNRQDHGFADEVAVLLIVRVDRHRGIAEHGLGTGGGHLDIRARLPLDGVAHMPEAAGLLGINHLGVRERREAVRAPVDDAVAAVNQPLFVKLDKHLAHRARAALVKGEALAGPVTGGAQLFELPRDARLVLVLPMPDPLEEFLPPQVVPGQALLLAQALLHLDLGGNAGVVGARHPQRVVALHPLVAHQNVLQGFVQRVTHVQLSGDVRWGNDDRKVLGPFVRVGREIALVAPALIDAVLKIRRPVGFGQLVVLIHNFLLHGSHCEKNKRPTSCIRTWSTRYHLILRCARGAPHPLSGNGGTVAGYPAGLRPSPAPLKSHFGLPFPGARTARPLSARSGRPTPLFHSVCG